MASDSGFGTTRGGHGFTLMEVLISMALFTVALTLLLGGFRFTSKAWEAGERVTAHTSELETVHRVFGNMLGRLYPVSMSPVERDGYAFSGTGKRLRFAAQLPPYPGAGGLYSVEFDIVSGNDLERLVLKIAPFDAKTFDDVELKSDEKSLLLETTGRLSFSYYDLSIAEQWLEEWPEGEAPPQTIKLQFQDSDAPWPEIVAPVSIDTDLACAFPALGGECRLDR